MVLLSRNTNTTTGSRLSHSTFKCQLIKIRGEGILIVTNSINHKILMGIFLFSVETSLQWCGGRLRAITHRAHQAFLLLHSTIALHTHMPGDTVTLVLTIHGVVVVVQLPVQAGI